MHYDAACDEHADPKICLQSKAAAGAVKQVSGAGQSWAVPNTLAQLMDVLKAPSKASGKEQLRIIAGNTGSGTVLGTRRRCHSREIHVSQP